MKKSNASLLGIFVLFCSQFVYADALYSILNSSRHLESIEGNIQNIDTEIWQSQLDIENLMKSVNGSLTGSSGIGTYHFHDYQSYGAGADNWTAVMQMIKGGGSSGDLGRTINSLANQFPINEADFNKGVSDPASRQYYLMQAQTIYAARASSQLDYDKIQSQIAYQQMLQQQIEKTSNLKSALDLNNRIEVESNLINLEILRQAAISNQQQAMQHQGDLIHVLSNAKFLTKQ